MALSATGALGYTPFDDDVFRIGLDHDPDFIGAQSGSNDSGPLYLGRSLPHSPRDFLKRDLSRIIRAAFERRIPAVITGAGGNGTNKQLLWTLDIVKEVAAEHHLRLKVALVYAEPDRSYLVGKLQGGKIKPLGFPRDLTESDIKRSEVITAMMGVEPIVKALEMHPDLVMTARASDDATFAALAVHRGFDRGLALHWGKILECGALAADPGFIGESMIGILRKDHFVVEPASPKRRCTVKSVASHTLYEREDPFSQLGPGGMCDLSGCVYEQISDRAVRVSGSRFVPGSAYWIKLEGAAWVGFRVVGIVGIRDPILIEQIDQWLGTIRERAKNAFPDAEYVLNFYQYGREGVMKDHEPFRGLNPHEIGLVTEVVATQQQLAIEVCEFVQHVMFSFSYPHQLATAGNLAHINSLDVYIPRNEVCYEFSVDHLLEVDDPCECFPMQILEI